MDYHTERDGMQFHDSVGVDCKRFATTEIKEQVPDILAKGCVFVDCLGIN